MNPNPFASEEEATIRAATVARIRDLLPGARIIHELNVEQGTVRADIAAVEVDRLYLFEIKSARDTLHRLPNQLRLFHPVCHGLVVVADEKWCGRATAAGFPNCDARAIIAHNAPLASLWQWPEPERPWGRDWTLPAHLSIPWPHRMLRLLWTEELRDVARDLEIPTTTRAPGYKLAALIANQATGSEITAAVCRTLRRRTFAWADPIQEQAA